MNDLERQNQGSSKCSAKDRFEEVVNTVYQTASSKGWTVEIKSMDDQTWKYATLYVTRRVGLSLTEGNFDITVDKGVKVSKNILTPFNPHGLSDLHDSIMSELGRLKWLSPTKEKVPEVPALNKVEGILKRFHRVACQLHHRHEDRETLFIKDEYDVQDLLHSLLFIFFDDIRPEEYTPSYAGGSSRVDFLLKSEKIVVEVKKTNSKLRDKKIGEQLIIDIKRYQAHPDCSTLVCFVYDPDGFLKNPDGLIADISRKHDDLSVRLIISPTK
jgi:hypothetical protein